MKAIIIGAGIAGLSTAIALTRHGIDFELYERAEKLAEVGAGISLWANALDVLDRLGVPIHKISQPLSQTELRLQRGHKKTSLFLAANLSKLLNYAPPLGMVHRAELVEMLAELVMHERLNFGCELVDTAVAGSTVTASFTNGVRATGDVLIAADGIKSVVREQIQGAQLPRYAGYTCFRGISPRPSSIEPGYMGEWWGRGQRFGITTLPQDRIYWFATRNAPQGAQHVRLSEHVKQLFADWAEPVPEILATTRDNGFLHNDIIDRPPNPHQCQGAMVLIGDAAHATTPNLGQGGCMAIEDAFELAQVLAKRKGDQAIENVLKKFVAERFPRTSSIIRQSYRLGAMAQWHSPLACGLRDRLISTLSRTVGPNEMVKYARYRAK